MTKNDDSKYQLEEIITLLEQQKIDGGDIYYELGNIFISAKELVNTINDIVDIVKLDIKRYPDLDDGSEQVLELSREILSELGHLRELNTRKISEVINEDKYKKIRLSSRNFINSLEHLGNQIEDLKEEFNEKIKRGSSKFSKKSEVLELRKKVEDLRILNRIIQQENVNKIKGLRSSLLDSYWFILDYMDIVLDPEKEKFIYIAQKLYNRISEQTDTMWSNDVLNIITGLESITANPESDKVILDLPNTKNEEGTLEVLELSQLFYRYPPFEPIQIEDNHGIPGSNVWFIRTKHGFINAETYSKGTHIIEFDNPIYNGEILESGLGSKSDVFVKIKKVNPIYLMDRNLKKGYVLLKLNLYYGDGTRRKLFIKYGSKTIKKYIEEGLTVEEINKKYKNMINKSSTYTGHNLTYVWFCTAGYGLSTDPWDTRCPFVDICPRGKDCQGSRWSWRRQLFPKVFPVISRDYMGIMYPQEKISFIRPIIGRSVRVFELYKSAQFSMPYTGLPVEIEFHTPIGRTLPKTNIVGFEIPREYIELYLRSIVDNNANNITIKLFNNKPYKVNIRDILISKYYFYHKGARGLRTYSILSNSPKTLIKNYVEFKKKLVKSISENTPEAKSFFEWGVETLIHTLSHAFLGYISKELELEHGNLLYLIDTGKSDNFAKIIIAEDSPMGAIDLIGALGEWLKNHGKKKDEHQYFITLFMKEELEFLKEHKKELMNYEDVVESQKMYVLGDKDTNKIVKEMENIYVKYLDNGLVLDVHNFTSHLLLSEEYDKMLDKLIKNDDVKREVRHKFDDLIPYVIPNFCVDGCTSCVVMSRGCSKGIAQTYSVSKWLTYYFLESLIGDGNMKLRGPGNKYLSTLLKSLGAGAKKMMLLSPYLDDAGVEFLISLKKDGVKSIVLITNPDTANKYGDKLMMNGIEVRTTDKREHSKMYLIDDRILIETSANLNLNSDSYNEFRVMWGDGVNKTISIVYNNSRLWGHS